MKLYIIKKSELEGVSNSDNFGLGWAYIDYVPERYIDREIEKLSAMYGLKPEQIKEKIDNKELILNERGDLICGDYTECEKYFETYIWNRTYNTDEDMPEGLA